MKRGRDKTPKLKRRTTAPRHHRSSVTDLRKQLDQRTRELAEARKQLAETQEQQTATSEVLHSDWASRRKIDLAELITEPWILSGPNSWNNIELAHACRTRGIDLPKISLETTSNAIRVSLLATGPYVSTFARSSVRLYADRFSLTALPVDLPIRPWPVVVFTLKNRSLSPVVQRFIACAREVAKSFDIRPAARKS